MNIHDILLITVPSGLTATGLWLYLKPEKESKPYVKPDVSKIDSVYMGRTVTPLKPQAKCDTVTPNTASTYSSSSSDNDSPSFSSVLPDIFSSNSSFDFTPDSSSSSFDSGSSSTDFGGFDGGSGGGGGATGDW